MEDLIGFTSILFVSLIILILALRKQEIFYILIAALIIRIIFIILGNYFITLPDSTGDAKVFERMAWQFAQQDIFSILSDVRGPRPRFISWFIAIPYSLFGRSELMAQSISMFFGISSVYLGWITAEKIWNKKIANRVGWIITFFPSLVLYSVLVLREAYIVFFFCLQFME